MKEFWGGIQFTFAAIGGWLGWFLGGCDGLLLALVAFAVIDYITGVMCAAADKKLSSEVGFKGICRKVLIFLLVGIANILDVDVIGTKIGNTALGAAMMTLGGRGCGNDQRLFPASCFLQGRDESCQGYAPPRPYFGEGIR